MAIICVTISKTKRISGSRAFVLLLAACFSLTNTPVYGDWMGVKDGNSLLHCLNTVIEQMRSRSNNAIDSEVLICSAYMQGIDESHNAASFLRATLKYGSKPTGKQLRSEQFYCKASDVTNGQLSRISRDYLEKSPKYLHFPAGVLVYMALAEAFPCDYKFQ